MDNNNHKSEVGSTNWPAIVVSVVALAAGAYFYANSKITNMSTQYRTSVIVQIMTENSELQTNECDTPFENEINDLRTRGMKTDGLEPANIVSAATKKRCEIAKTKIEKNNDISKNAKSIKVPSDYISKNFF